MGRAGNYYGIIKQIFFLSRASILMRDLLNGVDHFSSTSSSQTWFFPSRRAADVTPGSEGEADGPKTGRVLVDFLMTQMWSQRQPSISLSLQQVLRGHCVFYLVGWVAASFPCFFVPSPHMAAPAF